LLIDIVIKTVASNTLQQHVSDSQTPSNLQVVLAVPDIYYYM